MDLNKAKNNYAIYISLLNEAIRQSGITKIKSSIAPRYSDFHGQRGYRIEFDKNFDGEIPPASGVTLYDPHGNKISDSKIIIKYLTALTKKIKEEGLSKKDGFFSEFFDILSGGLNVFEDVARIVTKFPLNYCAVKPVVKFIDFVANTNIHQNLKDNHYFDIDKETKGVCKFFDVSSVCNLAFRTTRFALSIVDNVSSIFFPVNYKSHYFPTITQKDLDKIEKEKTRRPVSSKSASHDGLDPNLTSSKSLPMRPRPHLQVSNERSKSVGQTPSPYWILSISDNQRDLFPSYQNPYYPPLAPTCDPSYETLSAGGNRYGLTPEQIRDLFNQARSQATSSNGKNSRVYGGGGGRGGSGRGGGGR